MGLYCLLFCGALVRPLVQTDTTPYNGRVIRTYDERSLYWLSWFFTWPGLLLALAGGAALVLRRWVAHAWIVLTPVLTLLPLYLWHLHNSPYLMWWGRRFVPIMVPSLILLISVALAAAWGAIQVEDGSRMGAQGRVGRLRAFLDRCVSLSIVTPEDPSRDERLVIRW